jgi:hypothetical protein
MIGYRYESICRARSLLLMCSSGNYRELIIFLLLAVTLFACAPSLQYTKVQKAEFEQTMALLDTPEKVDKWLANNFRYDWQLVRRNQSTNWNSFHDFWLHGIQYPIHTYHRRSGVCNDAANFAGYALDKAGYKVKILTAYRKIPPRTPSDVHTVCAFKEKTKWWVCGDTRNHFGLGIGGPFTDLKEAAKYCISGKLLDYRVNERRKGF